MTKDETERFEVEVDDYKKAWEAGRPDALERTRSDSVVLSVRVPRSVLEELTRRARAEGKPVSDIVRDLISRQLAMPVQKRPPHIRPVSPEVIVVEHFDSLTQYLVLDTALRKMNLKVPA